MMTGPTEGHAPVLMCGCGPVLRCAPAAEHAAPATMAHSCPHHDADACTVCRKVTAMLWRELCADLDMLPYTVEPERSLPGRDLLS